MLSANLHRRHLTTGQHAAIVASVTNWAQAQPASRPKAGNLAGLQTVADRATQSGASATLALFDPEAFALMLGRTPQTVEDRLRDGTLPGVKLGRSSVIPAVAQERALCDLALEQAAERRKQAEAPPSLMSLTSRA